MADYVNYGGHRGPHRIVRTTVSIQQISIVYIHIRTTVHIQVECPDRDAVVGSTSERRAVLGWTIAGGLVLHMPNLAVSFSE